MFRRLGGLILVCISLFFFYVALKGLWEKPAETRMIESAVYVEDGMIHKENEGKLVLVCGSMQAKGQAYDPMLDLNINAPCAKRNVDILECSYEDGEYHYSWVPLSYGEGAMNWKALSSPLSIGEFKVSQEYVEMMSVGREPSLSDFDSEDLNALADQGYYVFEKTGVVYISQLPDIYMDDFTAYHSDYESYIRYHYRIAESKDLDCCLVGIQKGERISVSDELDTRPIFEGAVNRKDVLSDDKAYFLLGVFLVEAINVVVFIAGMGMLLAR